MDSAWLLASISTLACVGLAVAVGLRRERSVIASTALGLLVATALWNGSLGFACWQGAGTVIPIRLAALGAFSATAFWLLLALRHHWPRRFRGGSATSLALVPAWLYLAAALTDESHGLAFRAIPGAADVDWAGPLTRVLFAWAFACVAAGVEIRENS